MGQPELEAKVKFWKVVCILRQVLRGAKGDMLHLKLHGLAEESLSFGRAGWISCRFTKGTIAVSDFVDLRDHHRQALRNCWSVSHGLSKKVI